MRYLELEVLDVGCNKEARKTLSLVYVPVPSYIWNFEL